MPQERNEREAWQKAVDAVWRGAKVVGGKVAEAAMSVDPDVYRHAAQMPLLAYTLLSPTQAPVEAGEDDGHPPLVLVHGLGGRRGDFLPMALYLRLGGRKRSYRIHFAPGTPVRERAEALRGFISEVCAVTGAPTVDVVAHSLGGIISRLALMDPPTAARVRSLTTLGTPHGGTFAARLLRTDAVLALRAGSEIAEELAAAPWPAGVEGTSLWSQSDLLVLPPESAAAPGTLAIEVSPFTHYSYLIDPRGWEVVRRVLSGDPPDARWRIEDLRTA
jgi:pimeloyl-ACP methyl ester carboxylesterase